MKATHFNRAMLAASILAAAPAFAATYPAGAATGTASSTTAGTAMTAELPLCSTLVDRTVPKVAGVDCTADASLGIDAKSNADVGGSMSPQAPSTTGTNQGSLKDQLPDSATKNGASSINPPASSMSPTMPDVKPNSAGTPPTK